MTNTITIRTQAEFDALPAEFKEFTRIEVTGTLYRINRAISNSTVYVYGSAKIGSVYGSAKIDYVYGSAKIGSVYGKCVIELHSSDVQIGIVGLFSVIILWGITKAKIGRVAKSATILKKKLAKVTNKMLSDSLPREKGLTVFFKSVQPDTLCDFHTGRIKYAIGKTVKPELWDDDPKRQCGDGLHVSPTPHEALQYNSGKVLVVGVRLNDFVIYQPDLSKVRCKQVKVLREWNAEA